MQLSILSDDICRQMLFTNARKQKTRHNPSPLCHHRVFWCFFFYHFVLLACTYQKAQDTVHNKNTYNETSIQSYLFETKQSNQRNYVMRMLTEIGLGSYWMDTVGKSDE